MDEEIVLMFKIVVILEIFYNNCGSEQNLDWELDSVKEGYEISFVKQEKKFRRF